MKALAWSPHERNILASGGGTADRSIKIWNVVTGAAVEGVRHIAKAFPDAQITCGLSNVSFGLKPAAAETTSMGSKSCLEFIEAHDGEASPHCYCCCSTT